MRTSIVTGGTRGIGFAIARAIVDEGGRVMVAGRDAGAVASAVTALGDRAAADRVAGLATDVRDEAAVGRLVQATVDRFGSLDTLVNNAGIGVFSDVAAMTTADWSRVIDTNLTGVFHCTRAALPWLKRGGGGWVVNIASLAGRNYFPGGAAYCASKAGLIAFSEALMQEVRFDNISVTVIMPGSVATEFSGPVSAEDESWKLHADDVASAVMDVLRHPGRSLASKIEIRPSQPKSSGRR